MLERAAEPSRPRAADLCVFFGCHQHVVSMPARRVERLVLQDEVRLCRSRDGVGAVSVVQAGSVKYAAWNLGRMVELPPSTGSWVLLRVTHQGAELPLALAVGACLVVGPLARRTPLPPGLFRERRSALWATFSTAGLTSRVAAGMGLCLDPLRLWSRGELDQSAAALVAAGDPL
jgi:hypothetical protein